MLDALAASPVVAGIAAASTIPLDASSPGVSVAVPGRSQVFRTRYRFVSPGYFDLFDVVIRSGRNFTLDEARSGAPVGNCVGNGGATMVARAQRHRTIGADRP